jgi:putative intracellular protease/amidase
VRKLGALVFPGFETLDLFGPLQIFGSAHHHFDIVTVAHAAGPLRSAQGQRVMADVGFDDCPELDLLLVPGGQGTRPLVDDADHMTWIGARAARCELTMSVCTGAGLLARAGALDGLRATTNKLAFEWVVAQGPGVDWIPEARWVDSGSVVTAAGVSAGIDMALAVVARLVDVKTARLLAQMAEYDWHEDPSWDPFARLAGLV